MWERLRGYRTVIFHSLYGVPMAALAVLDIVHEVDVSPILERIGVAVDDIPLVLCVIAVVSVILRAVTTTPLFRSEPPPADPLSNSDA